MLKQRERISNLDTINRTRADVIRVQARLDQIYVEGGEDWKQLQECQKDLRDALVHLEKLSDLNRTAPATE